MITPELELDEARAAQVLRRAFFQGLRPPPVVTVSEWADEHRVLDTATSSEPGPWRTDRTPYLREIMDSLSSSSPVRDVVFVKGSQIGGTEVGNNWLGYIIDHAPGPMMLVLPTEKLLKRTARSRIDPMLRRPPLLEKVGELRSREAGNTLFSKEFPGGILVLASATSPADLRSMPVRYLFLDEIDAYEHDLKEEGDPVELAQRGTRTFRTTRKTFKVSTPTTQGASRIVREFQRTDRRYYHVPCPHCGHQQRITWSKMRWDSEGAVDVETLAIELEDGTRPVRLECESEDCGELIDEHHKTEMLAAGVWIPENPGRGDLVRGYHLSALYSPFGWFSWQDAAAKFVLAKAAGPALLRVWVNQTLGETWTEKAEPPDWRRVYDRREEYSIGVAPPEVAILTMGVDVQGNRLELEVVGWGEGRQSWSVDYRILPGDPQDPRTWTALAQAIATVYPSEDGRQLPVDMVAIDSGYETNLVYQFCRTQPPSRVMAVKGMSNPGGKVMVGTPQAVDVTVRGRKVKRGTMFWPIDTGLAKEELYSWLRLEPPLEEGEDWPPGYCHFPQYGPDHFKQLISEELVPHRTPTRVVFRWQKRPGQDRNETLDCRVYARVAAAVRGIDRWSVEDWKVARGQVGSTATPVEQRPRRRESRWPRRTRKRT